MLTLLLLALLAAPPPASAFNLLEASDEELTRLLLDNESSDSMVARIMADLRQMTPFQRGVMFRQPTSTWRPNPPGYTRPAFHWNRDATDLFAAVPTPDAHTVMDLSNTPEHECWVTDTVYTQAHCQRVHRAFLRGLQGAVWRFEVDHYAITHTAGSETFTLGVKPALGGHDTRLLIGYWPLPKEGEARAWRRRLRKPVQRWTVRIPNDAEPMFWKQRRLEVLVRVEPPRGNLEVSQAQARLLALRLTVGTGADRIVRERWVEPRRKVARRIASYARRVARRDR